MSEREASVDIAIIGAGSIGISVAYYLSRKYGLTNIALIEPLDPISLTSAQSGENYRNWWPHPTMAQYTSDGIALLEDIARESDNRINMSRRGYVLVTRKSEPADLLEDLYRGYGADAEKLIRVHRGAGAHDTYQPPVSADWTKAPDGVDVLLDQELIRKTFPTLAPDIASALHVRRAGAISGQQLGQFQLEKIKAAGGRVIRGKVIAIEGGSPFDLVIQTDDGQTRLRTERVVNAAGPFLRDVAKMMGEDLPVFNVFQQKIAFEDREGAVPRNLPFTIDLDGQVLDWTEEEREILAGDPETVGLTRPMVGGIHCRPDGAEDGKWIKMGWAFNESPSDPHQADPASDHFPDIVLRAASRLQPKLAAYIGKLPRGMHHYGGYYTMTEENWPLIGPMKTPGAFVCGALSGFGTMAATISGSICAGWMAGGELPAYASTLSLSRYDNPDVMRELAALSSRGVL